MSSTIWIVIVILVAVGVVYFIRSSLLRTLNKERDTFKGQLREQYNSAQRLILRGLLDRIIAQMDTTTNFYTNEDEASRELTSCLNILGHKATYHYQLGGKRTADIFVDNCIIESKLDPNQSDIDRLVGQVGDYASNFAYHIFIVIFGNVSADIIDRIHSQLISLHDNIELVFRDRPNRVRQ